MRAPYVTTKQLARVEKGLTHCDRAIIDTLDRLRVATTEHLRRLHFSELTALAAARQALRTLRRLSEQQVVLRLERQLGGIRAGSRAAVWSLDRAGQRLASACGPAGGSAVRRPWTPNVTFLAHRLAVTECYVELVEQTRTSGGELLDFDAEPLCWRRFTAPYGGVSTLKPDAFVRLTIGDYERGAFVEIDRATEAPSTLKRKLSVYRRFWESGRAQERHGYFPRVVFAVPSAARKAVVVDVCAAQPEETWPLYQVVLADELAQALTSEGPK